MLFFSDCEVKVNGSGIFADSASFSTQNSIQSYPILGYKSPSTQMPNDIIRGNISVSYFVEADNEPNLNIINKIKSGEQYFTWEPEQIVLGGITGYGYLEGYNLKINPLEPGRAQANYSVVMPLSGSFSAVRSSRTPNYTGMINGWNTSLLSPIESPGSFLPLDMTYNFRAAWNPVTVFGEKNPMQVQFLNGEESLSMTAESTRGIAFSGTNLFSETNGYTGISLRLYGSDSEIHLSFDEMVVKSTQINGSVDDVLRVNVDAGRFF